MKKNIFRYLVVLLLWTSCVQKMYTNDMTPKKLPKEVPEFKVTEYSHDRAGFELDSISFGSMSCFISRILVSKHEITNKYFCYFLNVDSIRTNQQIIAGTIDLSHPDCKIELKNGLYCAAKGYDNYPVVLVSWWGAKKYCEWLTAYVNKQRDEKGLYHLANYRLPSEFEWMVTSNANGTCKYPVEVVCDEINSNSNQIETFSHNIKQDTVNAGGLTGINENVYEWIDDNFYTLEYVMDFSMASTYHEDISANAVVRKHGFIGNDNCGRISRLRTGFYSDTGFRIVQTCLGRSTGVEF